MLTVCDLLSNFSEPSTRPLLRIGNRVAEEVEEEGLGEGVELGEGARRLARNASARSSTSAIRRCSTSGGRGISSFARKFSGTRRWPTLSVVLRSQRGERGQSQEIDM